MSTHRDSTVIRRARLGDVPTIARIWRAGWIDGHAGNVPADLVRHRCGEQFAGRAQRRLGWSWVATSDDLVVGFVVVVGDEVEQLYVDRAERGSGVAAVLLRTAETAIRAGGHQRGWLAVVAGNRRARAFYTREGWHDSGLIAYEAETEDGSFTVPSHRYEIDLRGDHPDCGGLRALTTRRSSRRVGVAWSPLEAFQPAPAVDD